MDTILFFPILFHYEYCTKKKLSCFLTFGLLLGGPYFKDENNHIETGDGISAFVGSGIAFKLLKIVNTRITPTLRYNGNIFPGILMDFSLAPNK